MRIQDNWLNIGCICEHCGKRLESRPTTDSKIVLKGCEPMEHRHIHDKTKDCKVVIENGARPYSSWGVRDKYYEALNKG